jgi:hypothetical protein
MSFVFLFLCSPHIVLLGSHFSERTPFTTLVYSFNMRFLAFSFIAAVLLLSLATAQLSGDVGPSTTRVSKTAKKVCNVLNYGGKASKTSDVGPAIASAFAACKSGGTVYIPPGDYGMSTWVSLSGGTAWALQLDGIIYRTGYVLSAAHSDLDIDGNLELELATCL